MPIFFLEKLREAFVVQKLLSVFQQNISAYLVIFVNHVMSWPLNELVKLIMLWTTGPRSNLNRYIDESTVKLNEISACEKNAVMVLWQICCDRASHQVFNCLLIIVTVVKWIHVTAFDVLPQKELYTPDYTVYHNLSTISSELAKIVASNPQYVQHFKEYTSRQGRLQHVIHVSNFLMQKDEEKVKILFSFGEHAREFFLLRVCFSCYTSC